MRLHKASNAQFISNAICLFVFVVLTFLIQLNFVGSKSLGRSFSLDVYTNIFPFGDKKNIAQNYLFIDIDEKSLSTFGQWPWPRVVFADLLKKILSAKPTVVGVDILFSEADRFNPAAIASLALGGGSNIASQFPNGDEVLGAALIAQPVVLATAFNQTSKNKPKKINQILVKDKARLNLPNPPGIIFPIEELGDASGYGFVNVDLDQIDTTVRYLPLLATFDGEVYPSFVLEMVRVAEEDNMFNLNSTDGLFPVNTVATGFLNLPVTLNGNFVLHHGDFNKFRSLSLADILNPGSGENNLAETISNKIIILGSSATGLNDLHSTSLESAVPGALIQLATIHQIMSERFLNFSPEIDLATVGLLFVCLVFICFIAGKDRLNLGLISAVTLGALLLLTSLGIFYQLGFVINLFLLVAFVTAALSLVIAQSTFVVLNKRALQSAFGQYLSPEMVKKIEKSGEKPELGGEKKLISIVMTDMRNFTSLGESYGEDVGGFTTTMNRYMTAIAQPVLDNHGALLKFIGDASLHIHGAPIDDKDHALKSVRTALEMFKAVEEFNLELAQEEKPLVGLGIGVNSGETVVGNIGAKTKFGYDILGDPVSVAARLESQTKNYGVLIIVGPDTVALCGDKFDWWELDNIVLKGKEKPLRIYTVHKPSPEHSLFLENYYAGDWNYILSNIELFKLAAPGMIKYYDNMILRLQRGKPEGWDGVYRATSK